MTTDPRKPVIDFLAARGAGELPHPGGTLLAHLERVHALLCEWQARPAVRLAGLCHAFYGTDGFPTALGEVTGRNELAAVIGDEARAARSSLCRLRPRVLLPATRRRRRPVP